MYRSECPCIDELAETIRTRVLSALYMVTLVGCKTVFDVPFTQKELLSDGMSTYLARCCLAHGAGQITFQPITISRGKTVVVEDVNYTPEARMTLRTLFGNTLCNGPELVASLKALVRHGTYNVSLMASDGTSHRLETPFTLEELRSDAVSSYLVRCCLHHTATGMTIDQEQYRKDREELMARVAEDDRLKNLEKYEHFAPSWPQRSWREPRVEDY